MRKIIILVSFLVAFLGTKAQVNPESFPLVTPLGTDNVYSQTGGVTKKFTLKSILDLQDGIDTISVTYADFYNAITNNQLIGGMTYVITDFQTVYDQMDFDASGSLKPTLVTKTGATEQIWVLALAPDKIASQAYSATYPNDEIQYDWTYNATLINGSPAKGRISERIDEWNNRTDYDHRVIKFIRYDDGAGNFTVINDNGNTSQEFLTFGNNYGAGGIIHDNWLGDFYSIGQFLGQEYSNNVFQGNIIITNKTSTVFYNNTFMLDVVSNSFNGELHTNSFNGELYSNSFSGNLQSNSFDGSLYSNSFSGELFSNSFDGSLYSNSFSGELFSNSFGGDLNSNSFGGDLNSNSFGGYLNSNSFGGYLNSNSFNGYLQSNSFGGYLNSNSFGGYLNSNSFGGYLNSNSFNGYLQSNSFGGYLNSNSFGGDLNSNSFGGDLNSNSFIFNTHFSYTILNGQINGKTIDDVIYPFLFGTDYEKRIFKASDGNVYARYFDGTNDINILIP